MRISRERMYMDVAQAFARRSTCFRNNVGAVIVYTGSWVINGTGYNGPPSGDEHCKGNDCDFTREGGCRRAIHAEINALDRMEYPVGPQIMFTTRSPCWECAVAIRDSGAIDAVYYDEPYRDTGPLVALTDAEIPCFRVMTSGLVIEHSTGIILGQ